MKRLLSLIKATMTDNMNLFKIKTKNKSDASKKILPIALFGFIACYIGMMANDLMDILAEMHVEYVLLTMFVALTTILTVIEGIYKSSNLLFNCRDDNMLLSLPIKKSTILFVRIFKFYVFEVLYNSLFLLPAIVIYAIRVNVGVSYYVVSTLALLLLPIIPIAISCIIGFITTSFSSRFKYKNIVQIIVTMAFGLAALYASFIMQGVTQSIAQNATNINGTITSVYYPADAYIRLVTNFNIQDLLIFVGIHVAILFVTIFVLSKVYFKINSRVKSITAVTNKNREYKIKSNKPVVSLIKKELSRFISSPVFVTNAAFGLLLFIVAVVIVCIKFDSVPEMLSGSNLNITLDQLQRFIPIVLFGLVAFAAYTSSITSSMISLEGKSFNILKSLPVKASKIILSKVYTAVLVMLPFIFVGDIIFFVRFSSSFTIIEIISILVASIILPLISETIGIIMNLKYPKMDAENDTEVVKQSMSSAVSVFAGFGLTGITLGALVTCAINNIDNNITIVGGTVISILLYLVLVLYLKKRSIKDFNKINV